jgi:hypothetical protein
MSVVDAATYPARRRAIVACSALLAVAFLAIVFADPHQRPNFDDTGVYWGAGSRALRHETAYAIRGHYTFNYLPFAALFYAFAFAVFPIHAFAWTFYILSIGGWIAVVVVLGRAVLRETLGRRDDAIALVVFALFFGMGLRDELKLGQTMIIPLSSATAFILLYDRARRTDARTLAGDAALAGLLTFAIEMKIYFAVLVALMAFRREWRVVALVAAWHVFLGVGLPAIYHGPSFALSEHAAWFEAVRYATDYHMRSGHNMSVIGLVAKAGAPMLLARIVWFGVVVAFLAYLWRIRDASPICGFCACLAAVIVLNPIAWPYWMLLGFPAMLWIVGDRLRRVEAGERGVLRWAVPALVIYFAMGTGQNEDFSKYGGLTVACAGLVVAMLALGRSPTQALAGASRPSSLAAA